jgi:hypothetical protein
VADIVEFFGVFHIKSLLTTFCAAPKSDISQEKSFFGLPDAFCCITSSSRIFFLTKSHLFGISKKVVNRLFDSSIFYGRGIFDTNSKVCEYSFGFVTHHTGELLLKNDRPLTPGQKKKALAAITSMLGNIKAYFPNMEAGFLLGLQIRYPELFTLAVGGGVINETHSIAACGSPVLSTEHEEGFG